MSEVTQRRFVAVIGGRSHNTSLDAMALAEATGAELARRGFGVVCGGGDGVMEAACRGCRSAGGLTVGVLKFNTAAHANPYVDIAVPTSMDVASNNIIIWMAVAVLAFEGRYGTLNEIALALDFGRPLIMLGRSGLLDTRRVDAQGFLHWPDATVADTKNILDRMQQMMAVSDFAVRSNGAGT